MSTTTLLVILLVGIIALAVMVIILLVRQNDMARNLDIDIDKDIDAIAENVARLSGEMSASAKHNAEFNAQLRDSVENNLRSGMKTQGDALTEMSDRLTRVLKSSLSEMQDSNERRLDKIQGVVGEKLDKTLNDRLDSNFKQVGEQLGNLYKSLGELKDLSSGVQDLNKTLTNVKARGTWGEVQLERILAQTLAASQYDKNVKIKKNANDFVEFAVKLPGPADGEIMYLPIDSKFPSDMYNQIVDAAERADTDALSKLTGDLKRRILDEARTIRDKYIDPPQTTNYAIMFLPTEGLYAEVLRIDGLTEECQKIGVVVAGPTTITAVLNSLQAGFRNVQLSKKSVEVMKLLEAIKAQFARMDEEVEKTQKKLSEAAAATDALQHRTQIIQKRMKKIGEIDAEEADQLLGVEE